MKHNLGQVVLVKDIRPGSSNYDYNNDFNPSGFTEFNDKLYFTANNGEIGNELWVSDGTTDGTQLLADINPGGNNSSSNASRFTKFNGKLYFAANDGENGRELWVSDGTTDGTQLLADINPDNNSGSNPSSFTEFNGKLYFTANDGEIGNELWVSDGTTDGTQLLADINTDNDSGSYAYGFTEFNGKLYFTANDGENGGELWVSDGTSSGTQLLIDISPDNNYSDFYSNNNSPRKLTESNGKLYFTADDVENGRELWVSDGTSSGTQLVLDINPGDNDYYSYYFAPTNLIDFNNKLYFTADDGENGRELWVSDGTAEGTQLLVDIRAGSNDYGYNYGSYLGYFTEFDGKLYFSANDGKNGLELWVSDGTAEGTQLLVDINPGNSGSNPVGFTEFEGKLYFTANDGKNGQELWISDGTAEGTQLVSDINSNVRVNRYPDSSDSRNLTEFNDKLFFTADDGENGNELWVSDGTAEGTQLLVDINPGSNDSNNSYGSNARDFTEFEGKLYFSANDGENGDELWVSDGTAEGTQLVSDINPSSNGSDYSYGFNPVGFTEFEGKLYFSADDGENGRELWVTDGTAEGTQLVSDINPNSENPDSSPRDFTEFENKLYFSADDGENGNELWVSDGTSSGTQLLVDLRPGSDNYGYNYGSNPGGFTEFEGKLYFSANDGENGSELWVSDGTVEGTQLLVDLRLGSNNYGYNYSSSPGGFTEFEGKLYFTANDGENGRELWVSDGTSSGTQLLADINPSSNYGNSYGSYARNFTEFDGKLYFTADNGENGDELWVTDGTSSGTQLVADINSGSDNYGNSYSSNADDFTVLDGKLYFTADDGENGRELWVSDGTTEGTQLAVDVRSNDVNTNTYGSFARDFTVVDDELFFTADDGETGRELFKLTIDEPVNMPVNIITGNDRANNLIGTDGADRIDALSGKDTLSGGAGNDTLAGGEGKDSLAGGIGDDLLSGGNSKDTLDGGAGNDTLTGGNGKDTFILRSGEGEDIITDFQIKLDKIYLGGGIEFKDLTLSENTIQAGDELLATLEGIHTNNLTSNNFDTI